MSSFRKSLLLMLLAAGLTLLAVSLTATEGTALAVAGPKISFLFILATLVFAFLPARKPVASVAEPKPVSRTLPNDVLNDPSLTLTLPERMAAAIEASKLQSRLFGVVVLRPGAYDAIEKRLGEARAQEILGLIAERVRKSLRKTDSAAVNDRDEVLVCLPLLNERRDLDTIAGRLVRTATAVLGEVAPDANLPIDAIDVGIAMYPIGGYQGEELIKTAQTEAAAARAKRRGRPSGALPRTTDPKPIMPPRKATRPRRRIGAPGAVAR